MVWDAVPPSTSFAHGSHDVSSAATASFCIREPFSLPPPYGSKGHGASTHASPYGKGVHGASFMPPLMVRGGVEQSETEGIRVNPQKERHLLCSFCPYSARSAEQERKGTLPQQGKEGGKTAI